MSERWGRLLQLLPQEVTLIVPAAVEACGRLVPEESQVAHTSTEARIHHAPSRREKFEVLGTASVFPFVLHSTCYLPTHQGGERYRQGTDVTAPGGRYAGAFEAMRELQE